MGEPSFNRGVLDVLSKLPLLYNAPGLMPAVSTIAPEGTDEFFEGLLEIKRELYQGRFQLQFSIHTTDLKLRDWLMPVRKWDFERIAGFGEEFFEMGDRKVALNFALADGTLLLMVGIQDATMYDTWKAQEGFFHESVPDLGDEAFLGPSFGEHRYVLIFRKGGKAVALSSHFNMAAGMEPFLNQEQLREIAMVIIGRL